MKVCFVPLPSHGLNIGSYHLLVFLKSNIVLSCIHVQMLHTMLLFCWTIKKTESQCAEYGVQNAKNETIVFPHSSI